jgi:hypothetical protein
MLFFTMMLDWVHIQRKDLARAPILDRSPVVIVAGSDYSRYLHSGGNEKLPRKRAWLLASKTQSSQTSPP